MSSKTIIEDEDAELKYLEKEIGELRSAKKELFEKARPINEELERIAQREREYVDRQHRLIAEKHDRERQKQTFQQLAELKSEIERLKGENETLKRENVTCSEKNNRVRQSLHQANKYSKVQLQKIAQLQEKLSAEQRLRLENFPSVRETLGDASLGELRKQLHETRKLLNKTTEELSGTRQRLSEVQERLTVAEQVTAATQQRELQESGNSDELQLELQTPQRQSTTHTGDIVYLYCILCMIFCFTGMLELSTMLKQWFPIAKGH